MFKDLVNIKISKEDFLNSDYLNILKKDNINNYSYYYIELEKQGEIKLDQGEHKVAKVLLLLSDLCSMLLKPESINKPYEPMMVMDGRRTTLPQDFTDDDLTFFTDILNDCQNIKIKARIADILWLRLRDDRLRYSQIAIENYINFSLSYHEILKYSKIAIENYINFSLSYHEILNDSKEAFHRGIRLTLQTNQQEKLEEVKSKLFKNFDEAKIENPYHRFKINSLLELISSHLDENVIQDLINGLHEFAEEFKKQNDWRAYRMYLQACREWYKYINDEDNIYSLTSNIAESFVKEVEDSEPILKIFFYNDAITEYRTIPKKYRQKLSVDKKLNDLESEYGKVTKLSQDGMQLLKSELIDISPEIQQAETAIKGKSFEDAIVTLVSLFDVDATQLEEKAKKQTKMDEISKFCSTTVLSSDGRVIDKNSDPLQAKLSSQYQILINLRAQSTIYPALYQFLIDHRISKEYIFKICINSSIVPTDRVDIWVEGLFFGFEKNFLVASHLLVPQVENLVRVLLKQIGVVTVTHDNGIEMEKGLSSLLDDDRIKEVFPDHNLLFEFKQLLTNQLGLNLRNNIAHGLCPIETFGSYSVLYFWHLCFKLVVMHNGTLMNRDITNQ